MDQQARPPKMNLRDSIMYALDKAKYRLDDPWQPPPEPVEPNRALPPNGDRPYPGKGLDPILWAAIDRYWPPDRP